MAEYDLGMLNAGKYLTQLGPKGQLITGPLKAAQRFSAIFLTEKGSVPYDPDYGTDFLYFLKSGMIRGEVDVVSYFNEATSQALDTFESVETVDNPLPDDEAIEDVQIDHFELDPPNLLLYVILTMRSGDTVTVTLPVTEAEEVPDAN